MWGGGRRPEGGARRAHCRLGLAHTRDYQKQRSAPLPSADCTRFARTRKRTDEGVSPRRLSRQAAASFCHVSEMRLRMFGLLAASSCGLAVSFFESRKFGEETEAGSLASALHMTLERRLLKLCGRVLSTLAWCCSNDRLRGRARAWAGARMGG